MSKFHGDSTERVPLAAKVLIVFTAGWGLLFALGSYRTFGTHEAYVVVPARAMLAGGDWIVPDFAGLPRLTKPPGMYWLMATIGTATGELNEWVVRVPVAISALAVAAFLGFWARRWHGVAAGWATFLVYATSVAALTYGRRAEMDHPLCLLLTLAMFLAMAAPRGQSWLRGLPRWTAFFAILSIGWMLKFHFVPAMALAAVGTFLLVERRFADLKHAINPIGWIMLAAAILLWPLAVLERVPHAWDIWRMETVGRAIGEMGHQPIWFYLPHLLLLTLPWTPFWIDALPTVWRAVRAGDSNQRFLVCWTLSNFAILCLSVNKHANYALCLIPPLSLWAGPQVAKWVRALREGTARTQRIPNVISLPMLLGCGIAIAYGLVRQFPDARGLMITLGLGVGIGTALVTRFASQRKVLAAGVSAAVLIIAGTSIVFGTISPRLDHRQHVASFAQELRAQHSLREITMYKMGQTPLAWYLGANTKRIEGDELPLDQPLVVIAHEHDLPVLRRNFQSTTLAVQASAPRQRHPRIVLVELWPRSVRTASTKDR